MQMTINGRATVFLGVEPYTRKDGSQTYLNVWRKHCAHPGCSTSWRFKTPAGDDPSKYPPGGSSHKAHAFAQHHCAEHRPKRKTKPTTYASRKAVSDEDVALMHELAKSCTLTRGGLYQSLGLTFGISPGTVREILAGRRRGPTT